MATYATSILRRRIRSTVFALTVAVLTILFASSATQAQTGNLTWRPRARMPLYQGAMGAATISGVVYTIGGAESCPSGSPSCTTGIVQTYDTLTDTWTRKRDMPTRRINVGTYSPAAW
jgi:hypothetical protein